MATKKITVNELRNLVKQIMTESKSITKNTKSLKESKNSTTKKVTSNGLTSLVKQIIKENQEPFIAHGTYTVSNAGGYEIMLSPSGDAAKVRDAFGSENPETSEWLEIEYVPDEETLDFEPVIDPNGYNIPLSQVMRVNR